MFAEQDVREKREQMLDFGKLRNPVLRRCDNLRDPAVLPLKDGYMVYYTRYSNGEWFRAENWSVASVFTRDFITFEDDRDITPKNHASPGDPVFWRGRWVLPYQTYPEGRNWLCFSESRDGVDWSKPERFAPEANDLRWNTFGRAIDPTLVVNGDELHCFFVGSGPGLNTDKANLLGHMVTGDANLRLWKVLSVDKPLIGVSPAAPDGVENVAVVRRGEEWIMIYSEGLAEQHLAWASSKDLRIWTWQGRIEMPMQHWMSFRHGAPTLWKEGEEWVMLLMGEENPDHRSTLGMFTSKDAIHWNTIAEKA